MSNTKAITDLAEMELLTEAPTVQRDLPRLGPPLELQRCWESGSVTQFSCERNRRQRQRTMMSMTTGRNGRTTAVGQCGELCGMRITAVLGRIRPQHILQYNGVIRPNR